MNRRSFMEAILAAGVAPAIVGSGILMPVRKLWTPPLQLHHIGNAYYVWPKLPEASQWYHLYARSVNGGLSLEAHVTRNDDPDETYLHSIKI